MDTPRLPVSVQDHAMSPSLKAVAFLQHKCIYLITIIITLIRWAEVGLNSSSPQAPHQSPLLPTYHPPHHLTPAPCTAPVLQHITLKHLAQST